MTICLFHLPSVNSLVCFLSFINSFFYDRLNVYDLWPTRQLKDTQCLVQAAIFAVVSQYNVICNIGSTVTCEMTSKKCLGTKLWMTVFEKNIHYCFRKHQTFGLSFKLFFVRLGVTMLYLVNTGSFLTDF